MDERQTVHGMIQLNETGAFLVEKFGKKNVHKSSCESAKWKNKNVRKSSKKDTAASGYPGRQEF